MILIVDDHVDSSAALVRLLKRCGHVAAAAHSGRAALDWLRDNRPSVIVLDLAMPDMHGFEVLESIRNDPTRVDVPVLIFTGDYTYETMRRARRLGVKDVLVKGTVDWQHLCDTIAKHLS